MHRTQHTFKRSSRTAITVLAALLFTLATGCSSLSGNKDETVGWSNEKLYSKAQQALAEKDYATCTKYFERLEARNPFSTLAQQAQLNIPYCDWKQDEQGAALAAVNRFIRLHPGHPDTDYAYYLKGLINFNDDLGLLGRFSGQDMSERDPVAMRASYEAFKVVAQRYPHSKYAADAAQHMRYIVNSLAMHEVHAAQYYYKRGAYVAAVNRAQAAVQNYQNTPATEKALHIMTLSYRKLGEPELAAGAQSVLKATFPDSRYLPGNSIQQKAQH
jgi:outer membrane protein assembly factor BamD